MAKDPRVRSKREERRMETYEVAGMGILLRVLRVLRLAMMVLVLG